MNRAVHVVYVYCHYARMIVVYQYQYHVDTAS